MFIRNVLAVLSLSLAACGAQGSADEPTDQGNEAQETALSARPRPVLLGAPACESGTCADACICDYIACLQLGTQAEECDAQQDDCFDACE